MKKRSLYRLVIYILPALPVFAQPEEFPEGIVLDSAASSWLVPIEDPNYKSLLLEASNGQVIISSGIKGSASSSGGILLYGSPVSVVLASAQGGYDDSTFDVFKGSSWVNSNSPLFRIDGITGNSTFTGSNVSINGGTLKVGGSDVITTATASGVLTAQKFAKFSATNTLNVPATTVSTSSTTGALTVSGGLGVFGDAYINSVKIGRSGVASATGNTTNIAVGGNALNINEGARNVAIGENSMMVNVSGSDSVAVGFDALRRTTTGNGNSALGYRALEDNTTGRSNSGIGVASLAENTTGYHNTGLGAFSLANNLTGLGNVAVGYAAGNTIGSGPAMQAPSEGTYLGYQAKGLTSNETNAIVIGSYAVGAGSNTTVIGNTATTQTHLKGKTMSNSLEVEGETKVKGNATFESNTTFKGIVTLEEPQGDISMGIYE